MNQILSVVICSWAFWGIAACSCKMFWRFYRSGGPLFGFVGFLVGWLFCWAVAIHEFWITGSGFKPTIKEKIVTFHKEMHLWIRATLNPSQRDEILGIKLHAPMLQRMGRFMDPDFLD